MSASHSPARSFEYSSIQHETNSHIYTDPVTKHEYDMDEHDYQPSNDPHQEHYSSQHSNMMSLSKPLRMTGKVKFFNSHKGNHHVC